MKPLSDVGFTRAGEFIANEPAHYWPSARPCIISIGIIGLYHWLLRLLISIEAFARAVGERIIDRVLQTLWLGSVRQQEDNGAVRLAQLFTPFAVVSVVALGLSVPNATAQDNVRQIEIHSRWGGLGTPQNTDVMIRSKDGVFVRDGKRVDAAQVRALVSALQAPRIPKPDMDNLGVTLAWLKEHVTSQHPRARTQALQTTANQQELFTTSFTNPDSIAKVLPELFEFSRTDDYPFAKVELTFENGSKIRASSHSYYVYMLP